MGNLRLKDFIRAIRACKTAADERAVIAKESASIRTSFKEEASIETRHINISKLLYIHMLGHPAHFGQIECLKLVAGGKYPDKRLGYLGIMMLLDEAQEVLTLVTNSLKNDMNSSNMYSVGLALCTMGNIASSEMARDLAPEVEKLMGSSNSYIKKKAALCAIKIIRKVPDLIEQFVPKVQPLLQERNHAVILSAVSLITEICSLRPDLISEFRPCIPQLNRNLKSLLSSGNSPEYDVSGINDPFLQVRILRLLRILGKGDKQASDSMNDVLAQVATNTESAKNVGNAILYETCLTIMEIEADSGLRVLAINILGRFLANTDNNIRYVALNTLVSTIAVDVNAVQRHRSTILTCLHDSDISIKRRALELCFYLINESNVRVMIRELLTFLEIADPEFKASMPARICAAADQHAPNKRWHIDTILRVFKLAGNNIKEDVLSNFIKLIASVPDLQAYAGYKLYYYMKLDLSQEALVVSGVWCIGEYGDALLQNNQLKGFEQVSPEDSVGDSDEVMKSISQKEVLDLLEEILESPYNSTLISEYVLMCLGKLTARINDSAVQERIKRIILNYTTHFDLELQQRSVEFMTLLNDPSVSQYRAGILDKMPVPPPITPAERKAMQASSQPATPIKSQPGPAKPAASTGGNLIDDLLSLSVPAASSPVPGADLLSGLSSAPVSARSAAPSGIDLLADVFGGMSTGSPAPAASAQNVSPKSKTNQDILGLFGSTSSQPAPPAASSMLSSPLAGAFGASSPFGGAMSPASSLGMGGLPPMQTSPPKPAAADPLDLLGGLGSGPSSISPSQPFGGPLSPVQQTQKAFSGLDGLGSLGAKNSSMSALSSTSQSPVANPLSPASETIVYQKNQLTIVFKPLNEPGPDPVSRICNIYTTFKNSGPAPITDLVLQVAVTKAFQLQMMPATGTVVPPNNMGTVTQNFKILNAKAGLPEGKSAPIKLRLKLMYATNGGTNKVDEIVDFAGFPSFSW